jgi:glycosyltransferase involved in cell wall biosynthesis
MRVAHVITRLIVGGAQENTLASVLGLRKKPGLEVELISGPTFGPEGTLEPVAGAVPGLLRLAPALVRPLHPWKDLLAYRQLLSLFRQGKPRIVHTHSGKAGFLGRMAAHKAGVPVVVHTIHGPSFGNFQSFPANALYTWAERRAGRVTTHFVTVAHAMTRQYLEKGIGSPMQYTRIPSGFNLEPFLQSKNDPNIRARFGLGQDDVVIGKIARLFKLKGHDDLLAVAPRLIQRCSAIKFLLVGDGPCRERLESKAIALGLRERVVFTGLVQPESIPSLVGIMDLLAHLSRREGLPRALPQALAAGRPVVACDADGAGEVCLDQQTGFLVPPGDLGQLEEKLFLLACDANLRRQFGERGREQVRNEFAVERMIDQLHRLYLKLGNLERAPEDEIS